MALYLDGKEVSKVSTFAAGAKAELAGLMRVGQVTTATSTVIFESLDLRGQDDNAFPVLVKQPSHPHLVEFQMWYV